MPESDLQAALAEFPHFHSLPRELLARLATGCRFVRLGAGEVLFTQGEPVLGFYMVRSGAIQLHRSTPDGRDQILQTVVPGRTFAEAAVLSMKRMPASARALSDGTVVVEVCAANFLPLFREDSRLSAAMVVSLSMWLHSLVERIEELQIDSAPARLARYLLRLPSSEKDGRVTLELPMAKKDLAAQLAIAPETLSRLLRRWQDDGVLEARGRELAILDERVLTAIADREDAEA